MPPRKKNDETQEETQTQEETKTEETPANEEAKQEETQQEEAKTEEPQPVVEPVQGDDEVANPVNADEAYTGNAAPPAPPVSAGDLYSSRAVVDTSGTAGPADHDIRRGTAAFDKLAEDRDEVPEHLRKYVDSDEGYHKIVEREAERREDA